MRNSLHICLDTGLYYRSQIISVAGEISELLNWLEEADARLVMHVEWSIKGKGVPSSINEGWVPGGDPGPGSSPPQVAFSRAGAIQRFGGRSIRQT